MENIKKVCIVYSGQTRSYNQDQELWHSHKRLADELETRYNIHVDFIGHTWSDQPAPWNTNDFIHFKQESQSVIDQWIHTNFFKRAWWNPNNKAFQDFCEENFKNKNANTIIEMIEKNSRNAYGQIFSFFQCISQTENTYDAYFKTRWDIMIEKTTGLAEFFPYAIGENKNLVLFDGTAHIRPVPPKGRMGNTMVTETFIGDTNFIINKNAMECYNSLNWQDYLHQNIVRTPVNEAKPSSHTLWEMMHPSSIEGKFVLQGDCFRIARTPEDQEIKKEKNLWAI